MPIPEFPANLRGYGALRVTPQWRTGKAKYTSGAEQRLQYRMNPLYRFEIDYAPLLPPPLDQELAAFWDSRRGDSLSFWFQDWSTPSAEWGTPPPVWGNRNNETLGYGNGVRVLFKLHEDRCELATIYVNGVEQSQGPTPAVVVDPATGLVLFTVPPILGAHVTADVVGGWFRVRFEGDELAGDRIRPAYWRYSIVMQQVGTGATGVPG